MTTPKTTQTTTQNTIQTTSPRNVRGLTHSIQRLKREHRRLDQQIIFAAQSRVPDLPKLMRLKRLRLLAKEKLTALERTVRSIGRPIRPGAA